MKHTYKVVGMHCDSCAAKITEALQGHDHVDEVVIDRTNATAEVTMNQHIQLEEMNQVLETIGDYRLENYTPWTTEQKAPTFSKELPEKYTWKNFLPLICIIALVFLLTFVAQCWNDSYGLSKIIAHLMGFWFIVFGLMKLIDLRWFVEAYSMYDLIAQKRYNYGFFYPFIEIALGLIFILSHDFSLSAIANIFMVIIMIIGAIGVYKQLKKGNKIQCACLGTYFKLPMTTITLIEDLFMVILWIPMLFLMFT